MIRKIKPELAWGDYLELHIKIDIGERVVIPVRK